VAVVVGVPVEVVVREGVKEGVLVAVTLLVIVGEEVVEGVTVTSAETDGVPLLVCVIVVDAV
jgi:hypothetical protein